jgi:hypothetical protein
MCEKFVNPSVITDREIIWYDKSGLPHSFNGFPSNIKKKRFESAYYISWHKHGVKLKTQTIVKKTDSEIIAEKISSRNFQERAENKIKKK